MKEITIPTDALERFRAAASEFTGNARPRVSRLEIVRDEIAAMRAKGASFRIISGLLSQCGIRASDTCVMRFCHSVLGEQPFHARDAARRAASPKNRRVAPNATVTPAASAAPSTSPPVPMEAQVALLDDLLNCRPADATKTPAQGGPRIARIQFANPNEL